MACGIGAGCGAATKLGRFIIWVKISQEGFTHSRIPSQHSVSLPKIKFIKTVEDDELQKYPVITPLVLSIELYKGQGGFLQNSVIFSTKLSAAFRAGIIRTAPGGTVVMISVQPAV